MKKKQTNKSTWGTLDYVFSVWMVVVLATPFLRGLYWPLERFIVQSIVAVLVILTTWLYGRKQSSASVNDLLLFGVFLCYVGGIIRPASAEGSISSALMWGTFLAVYWTFSHFAVNERRKIFFVDSLMASTQLLAVSGLLAYAGLIKPGWLLGGNRLAAGFEYPNATANILMVGLLAGLMYRVVICKRSKSMWLTVGSVITTASFFLTLSRGAWLTFGLCYLAAVYINKKQVVQFLFYSMAVGLSGLTLGLFINRGASPLTTILAIGLAFLAAYAIESMMFGKKAVLRKSLTVLLCGAAAMVAVVLIKPSFISTEVWKRVGELGVSTLSSDPRIVFLKDASKIVKDSPLLGQGGGTWKALYSSVQSFWFGAAMVHNDVMEMLLDIGVLGLGLYLVFIGRSMWRAFMRDPITRIVAVTVVAIVFHSLGEGLIAFPAIYLYLFAALGLINNDIVNDASLPRKLGSLKIPITVACLSVTLVSMTLALGEVHWQKSIEAQNVGDGVLAITHMEKAARFNPYKADAHFALASIRWHLPEDYDLAETLLLKARQYEPHNSRYSSALGMVNFRQNQYDLSLQYYREALKSQPLNVDNYVYFAYMAVEAAINSAAADMTQTLLYAQQVLDVADEHELLASTIKSQYTKAALQTGPDFALYIGQAHAILGQYVESLEYLRLAQVAQAENVRLEAQAWSTRVSSLLTGSTVSNSEFQGVVDWERILRATAH